jgi:tetratricopeptide (TPR) repeat protein
VPHPHARLPRSVGVALIVISAARASAQCPDGTPPPCRGASSAPRRANPALNERAWIVVPFTNVTRAPDLDWLRDASVNLLSLDLSRWTDITVVDDKRVTDLVRELPPPRATQPLSLNDGLALARRAGAGRLVMGDFFKFGKGARLVANVFNVRDGSRMRSITQQAPDQDSLLTAFGPLARGVLAVPPPPDAKLGATGTAKLDAYQEYLLGATALNRFEITEATRHLEKALALDSTFALAHYKLSIAFHWGDDPDLSSERAHAMAAARLGGSLPPRERALISARVAASNGDDPRACATLGALVARDSMDVEALYGLGECEYHGGLTALEPIDSTHARFRGNWNVAISLFRRVLRLDPSYHPAFAHVLDALSRPAISVCRSYSPTCGNDPSSWTAILIRDGDSLLIQPVLGSRYVSQTTRAEQTRSRYLNLKAAQQIAREWVDAGPAEARAHLQLAEADMTFGEIAAAEAELRQIDARGDPLTRRASLVDRIEIAVVLGNGATGRALLDTLRREIPDETTFRRLLSILPAAFGQLRFVSGSIEGVATSQRWTRELTAYWHQLPLALLGAPDPHLGDVERRYWESAPGDSVCAAGLPRCRTTALLPTMAYALRFPRTWWPPFETPEIGYRFGPARGLAIGDAEYLRATFQVLDSISGARLRGTSDDQAYSLIAADAALALHDSAAALRLTRQFIDSVMPAFVRLTTNVAYMGGWRLLFAPRMMLQRADLAAALGFPDEARTWYARVLDLWTEADPELQPSVTRIRTALTALGPTRR